MASVSDWGPLVRARQGRHDHGHCTDDGGMDDYYSLFVPDSVPKAYLYLSYASVTDARREAPADDPYHYLAEFYRRVADEYEHAIQGGRAAAGVKRILATGCGLGGVGTVLAERYPGADVVCVDIVAHHIAVARRQLRHLSPRVSFVVGDVCALTQCASASVDVVYDEVVLSHFRGANLAAATPAMAQFRRTLAPGGHAVLSGYARPDDLAALYDVFAASGFRHVKTVNITAPNAEGSMRCLQHMLGERVARRMLIINDFISRAGVEGFVDVDALLLEDVGRLTALCKSTVDAVAYIDSVHSAARRRVRTGGDVEGLDALHAQTTEKLNALAAENEEWCGALPVDDVERYGDVIDVMLIGLIDCVSRARAGSRYKPGWVVVLEAVDPGSGLPVVSASAPARAPPPQSPLTLLPRAVNSVLTLLVLAAMRLGRVTRRIREHFGLHPCGALPAAPADGDDVAVCPVRPVQSLSPLDFLRNHLWANRPVVVTNAASDWPALHKWTPTAFSERYGDIRAKVQGAHFDVCGHIAMSEFLDAATVPHLPCDEEGAVVPPCVRYAYPRSEVAEVLRAFNAFSCMDWIYGRSFTHSCYVELVKDWHPPRFLPTSGFTFPWTLCCAEEPRQRFFYDFGVYVAPRGGVTRLHVDSQTNAVITLVTGVKRVVMVPPALQHVFVNTNVWPAGTPSFETALAALPEEVRRRVEPYVVRVTIRAGDSIFIPRGWMHEVYTDELSIMVTWNFIHTPTDLVRALADGWWHGYGGARTLHPDLRFALM